MINFLVGLPDHDSDHQSEQSEHLSEQSFNSDVSLQDYPMVFHNNSFGQKIILQMFDLTDIIFQFCDSQTLFTLSMSCKRLQAHLTSENTNDRSIKKGYLVRILKFKYSEASSRLKGIQRHLLMAPNKKDDDTPKIDEDYKALQELRRT